MTTPALTEQDPNPGTPSDLDQAIAANTLAATEAADALGAEPDLAAEDEGEPGGDETLAGAASTAESPKTGEAAKAEVKPSPIEVENARLRDENQKYQRQVEQERQAREDAEWQRQVADAAGRYAQTLENEGHTPEVAKRIAYSEAREYVANERANRFELRQAADRLNRETGMPLTLLAGYRDVPTMQAAATQYAQTVGPQNAEMQTMKQRVAQLEADAKKARAPVTTYDRGGGRGAVTSHARTLDSALRKAPEDRTPAENKAMARAAGYG